MTYSSWDIEHDRLKLVILGHFLLFYHKRTKKIKILKKWKKNSGDIIITHVFQKSQSYDLRFLDTEWDRHNFFVILGHFFLFYPKMNLKIKIKNKNEKKFLEILPLYTCVPYIKIIWHMVPEIWSVTERTFLPLWIIFWPFTTLTTWKIKTFKKCKITWRYHHFTKVYQIWWYMLQCSEDMVRDGCIFLFSILAYFFALLPPNNLKSQNIKKLKRNTQRYHYFIHMYQKL